MFVCSYKLTAATMSVDREFFASFNHTHSIKIYNFPFTLEMKDEDRREYTG